MQKMDENLGDIDDEDTRDGHRIDDKEAAGKTLTTPKTAL